MAEGGARVELDEAQRRLVASVREPLRKLAKVMRRDQEPEHALRQPQRLR